MKQLERVGSALVGWAVVLLATSSGATTLVHQDVPALTRGADAVVVGRVVKAESRWTADRRRIVTDVTVEVRESLKGAPPETVVVRQPGGQVGDIGQRVDGIASFKQGEEVVLFLQRRPDASFRVEGMAQGKYRVERSADGAAWAIPEHTGAARTVDPLTREEIEVHPQPMQLGELKTQIRRALSSAPESQQAPAVPVQKGTR